MLVFLFLFLVPSLSFSLSLSLSSVLYGRDGSTDDRWLLLSLFLSLSLLIKTHSRAVAPPLIFCYTLAWLFSLTFFSSETTLCTHTQKEEEDDHKPTKAPAPTGKRQLLPKRRKILFGTQFSLSLSLSHYLFFFDDDPTLGNIEAQ